MMCQMSIVESLIAIVVILACGVLAHRAIGWWFNRKQRQDAARQQRIYDGDWIIR